MHVQIVSTSDGMHFDKLISESRYNTSCMYVVCMYYTVVCMYVVCTVYIREKHDCTHGYNNNINTHEK